MASDGEAARCGLQERDRIVKINVGKNEIDVANNKSKINSILGSSPGTVLVVVERSTHRSTSVKENRYDIFTDGAPKRPSAGATTNRSTSSTRSSPRDIANQFVSARPLQVL